MEWDNSFKYDSGAYRAWKDTLTRPDATLTLNQWQRYRDILKKLSDKAADEFRDAVWNVNGRWHGVGLGAIPRQDLIDYAYALITKYSEGATEAACEFYDAIAALAGVDVPPAVPAATATVNDVGKTLNGVIKQSHNQELIASAMGRLVKQAGQDTTLQNALRDGAEFAWIPSGDTCAFCITLASRGWQTASKDVIKNGHAEHIHGNCDCAYGVRFNGSPSYTGYNPQRYKRMYEDAPLKQGEADTPKNRINAMRRETYDEYRDEINEQKRDAYAKRKALNSSRAEEIDVG